MRTVAPKPGPVARIVREEKPALKSPIRVSDIISEEREVHGLVMKNRPVSEDLLLYSYRHRTRRTALPMSLLVKWARSVAVASSPQRLLRKLSLLRS
jgi:hypothetical protein